MNERTARLLALNPNAAPCCCADCDETGEVDGEPCTMCGGTGEALIDEDGEALIEDG